ncbi:MAG: hypothetical protein IPO08_23245 [Xanthomonadales bacterium]|nr:hypothetical protein [Xanthomonadales bacterium]
MNDRELLELAAKAVGIVGEWCNCVDHEAGILTPNDQGKVWNPLQSDGDALRLAVTLDISILRGTYKVCFECIPQEDDGNVSAHEQYSDHDNEYAATRRAIVRAAAEIGRAMQ